VHLARRAVGPTRFLVAVLASCGLVAAFMQTLILPLIPTLPALLHTSAANASWVITVTLVAAAVITPVSGRLADLYGKRLVVLASLGALVAGSVVSALGGSLVPVVIGRGLQGCSMGVIPVGISMMRDLLPRDRVASAMAVMSATLGVGSALGLPISALLAQVASWHVLFWTSAGLGAVCLVVVWVLVPESPVRAPARFDLLGTIGLTAGLVCLLLAVVNGGTWGWTSPVTLGLLGAAPVVLIGWGARQLRIRHPLVDLRVTARRPVLFTNLASVLVGFSLFGTALVLPQLLQAPRTSGYGLGLPLFQAGLCMAPSGLVMMLLSPLSARLTRTRGPRRTLLLGALVIAIGYLAAIPLVHDVFEIVLATVVVSAGLGIAYAAMPALIMTAVPLHETASANGVNALMRTLGTATSSAAMATLLTQFTITLGTATLPSLSGFRVVYGIAALAALGAAAITALVPRTPPATSTAFPVAPPRAA
jgi:MFS family permease